MIFFVRYSLICFVLLAGIPAVHASVSFYMSPEDLLSRSDVVVEATVTRTASGLDRTHGTLSTYVTLAVDTIHRGPATLERVVIREPGGSFGEWVHDVDAVPIYSPGERVLAFLEAGNDGALRTTGMFFGKFTLDDDENAPTHAVRDLEGHGRIFGRPAGASTEHFALADLRASATVRTAKRRGPARAERRRWTAEPAELDRLEWDDVQELRADATGGTSSNGSPIDLDTAAPRPGASSRFVAASSDYPSRWFETDTGGSVTIDIEQARNPYDDGPAAVAEISRAIDAWTNVPESRVRLQLGNTNATYTSSYLAGPTVLHTGQNIVLFGDPYDEISDPVNCGGVLAIGGYWRNGSTTTVNNVTFYRAVQLYVVFNRGFDDCFYDNPDNLAEVATHELGHGLGFGHSTEPDALMRSTAYSSRGPRLGDDDRDAAHCHYPHTLTLLAPNGGQVLEAGSVTAVSWSVTAEAGTDPGTVDLEYSSDGGSSWSKVVAGTPNDGQYDWLVPADPGTNVRVRVVRPPLSNGVPAAFPESCSEDGSNASLTISDSPPVAGVVPDGTTGAPLRIETAPGGEIRISWDVSCSGENDDFAVYSGDLDVLRAGVWDAQPITCSAGADLVEYVTPAGGARFYLVTPLAGPSEGHYGTDSIGTLRPESSSACGVREAAGSCSGS